MFAEFGLDQPCHALGAVASYQQRTVYRRIFSANALFAGNLWRQGCFKQMSAG
jgi:hypothetical protein